MTTEIEIRNRGGWYYAVIPQVRGSGRALIKSLHTQNMEVAKAMVKDGKLAEIGMAAQADALTREVWTRLLAGRNVKVRDAVASFEAHRTTMGSPLNSIRREGIVIDLFLRHSGLANQSLAALDTKHIADFCNQPGPQKLSTRTLWLAAIKAWCSYLVGQRWLVVDPCIGVKIRLDGLSQEQLLSERYPAFTDAEVKKLLAVIPRASFWYGAVLFGYEYGLDLSTVAELEEGNVVAHQLRTYRRKGRRMVNERLTDDLVAWIDEWRLVRPKSDMPYLFPEQAAYSVMGGSQLSKKFNQLLVKHGITGRSFAGLRKLAAARRWESALSELGTREQQALAKLVAEQGFRRVQEMLAHAPGSSVTDDHYMPRATA